ncbi:MAG: TetR family transcriptional regulator, partial [Thermoanaerobaculia bacterium]
MKQRARRDEDKAERIAAILDAARELWSRSPWSDFTVGDVATQAGIVKGTVYLYFTSKERLLLAVFEEMLEEYLDDIDRALEKRRGRWSAAHVAGAFADALSGRDPFLRVLPILGAILEHNVDYPAAVSFKRLTLTRLTRTASLLEARLTLKHGHGLRFLLRVSALLTGLANMAFPAPVIQQVFRDEPKLRVLHVDLKQELLHALTALLHGME